MAKGKRGRGHRGRSKMTGQQKAERDQRRAEQAERRRAAAVKRREDAAKRKAERAAQRERERAALAAENEFKALAIAAPDEPDTATPRPGTPHPNHGFSTPEGERVDDAFLDTTGAITTLNPLVLAEAARLLGNRQTLTRSTTPEPTSTHAPHKPTPRRSASASSLTLFSQAMPAAPATAPSEDSDNERELVEIDLGPKRAATPTAAPATFAEESKAANHIRDWLNNEENEAQAVTLFNTTTEQYLSGWLFGGGSCSQKHKAYIGEVARQLDKNEISARSALALLVQGCKNAGHDFGSNGYLSGASLGFRLITALADACDHTGLIPAEISDTARALDVSSLLPKPTTDATAAASFAVGAK